MWKRSSLIVVAVTAWSTACGGSDEGSLDGATPADAAGTDAPVADTPAVDAPAVDAPAVDAPTDAGIDGAIDASPMSVVVTQTTVVVLEPTGPGATVGVSLASQPPGPVDVAITSADPTVATVTQATLSFTTADWATPRTFRIDGTLDSDVMHETTTITCTPSLSGWGAATIMVYVSDQSDPVLYPSTSQLAIDEGATGTFTIRISKMPAWTTNVTIMSSDVDAVTAAPATLEIPAAEWNQDHPVTVTGVQDADTNDETVMVSITATGLPAFTVTVQVNDDD